jgi:hypothetical protein
MSCTIKYNEAGGISHVLAPSGVESKLFKEMAKLPHMNSLEDALDMYKNIYSSELGLSETGSEPSLSFKSDKGEIFSTFADALKGSTGGQIETGIEVDGEFKALQKVSSNTNPATFEGFINGLIQEGIMSDQKIIEDGKLYHKAGGNDPKLQMVNEIIIKESAITDLGLKNFKLHKDGRIELSNAGNSVELNGENVLISDIRKMTTKDLVNKYGEDTGMRLAIDNAVATIAPGGARAADATIPEKDLKLKLLDLLNNMGVKVMSIESYIEKYKVRNGVEPTAKALADIANQVIAFKDGVIDVDSLTEETAHFITETWNQEEIQTLLDSIHKTDSYKEFAGNYREIYTRENPNMSASEIEDLVRREVLGKELATSLKSKFNLEGKTEMQQNILRRIYDFFADFFNKLTTNERFYANLENLTIKVEELLLSQDVNSYLNLGNTSTKKFRMYQLQGATGNVALDAKASVNRLLITALIDQERSLIKAGRGSSAEIKRLQDMIEKEATKSSVLEITRLAKRQSRYVAEAIERASKEGKTLNNEEGIVLHNLREVIQPLMSRLQALLEKDGGEFNGIASDIQAVVADINNVVANVENTQNIIVDGIIDRIMVRHNISDEYKDELRKAVETASRDTQTLYSFFGQLTHAHDPLLNLLGSVVSDMATQAAQSYEKRAKKLLQQVSDLGFNAQDLSKFYDKDGYILSLYDWSKFEDDILTLRAELYKKYSGVDEDVEKIKKQLTNGTIKAISDKKLDSEYKNEVTKEINKRIERSFTEEYYTAREKRYTDLNISEEARGFLTLMSTDLGQLMSRVKTEKGLPRYTLANKHELAAVNLRRRQAKSLYDINGILKNGIVKTNVEIPGSTIRINGDIFELNAALPVQDRLEATIAFDINKLDIAMIEEKNREAQLTGGATINPEKLAPKFIDELMEIEAREGREAAADFFRLNTTVGFSNDFWNSYDNTGSFSQIIDDYLKKPNGDLDIVSYIESYKRLTAERKAIIKQYQDSTNYTNTLADDISTETKDKVLEMSEDIDRLYSILYNNFKEDLGGTELEGVESTPNQAYFEALEDSRLTTARQKMDFALKHMTSENKRKSHQFFDILDELARKGVLSDMKKERVEKAFPEVLLEDITKDTVEEFKLKYAESRLLPYYKSFAPAGLLDFYTELKSGTRDIVSVAEELNKNPNVKLSNNFSYYELGTLKYKNENYVEGFEGGNRQPKLTIKDANGKVQGGYLNKRFMDMFNPKIDSTGHPVLDKDGKMVPQNNQKLFELYSTYMEFQKDSLRSYDEVGSHNIYLAPQISKTSTEKTESLLRGQKGTVKDWWQDIIRYRVDEQTFGEEHEGMSLIKSANLRVIPKYFLKKLESTGDVSTDLFYSSTMFAQQAELYKARRNKFSEFSALKDKLVSRTYPGGKAAEATNTHKMFMSYMDYNLFGVKENRQWRVTLPFLGQVDVTKIITFLHSWLRNNSLALNVVVPLTSWLTAEASIISERVVGQYIDGSSLKMARNEFRKLSTAAITEGLEINSTSKLSITGEYFSIFDLNNRFKDSKYHKSVRTVTKSMYLMHTMANFMPLSEVMLSQLYGHRVFGDKIVDKKKFDELSKLANPSISKEDLKINWDALKEKTLYNYIITKDNSVSYDFDKLAKDMGKTNDENFRDVEFRNFELGVISKIKKLVERVDGQIKDEERTVLQRDVFGRFTMTHKGWMSIAASNRFKRRHLNLQTGQLEEGTYLSAFSTFTNSFNEGFTTKGLKGGFAEVKTAYKNGNEAQKEAIRRVLIETGFLSALFLLSTMLGNWADDDEDNAVAQFTAYMFERVTNETASSQFGVIGEFYKSIKEPIVGLNKIETLSKVGDMFSSEYTKRGRYKDISKRDVYFIKNIVGAKGAFDLWSAKNLASQRAAYNFFNDDEYWILAAYLVDKED